MNNIIEYDRSEFFDLLINNPSLIDNLFIFENDNENVFYKGECQLVNNEYKFYFPKHNWQLKYNSNILNVIDELKSDNQTLFIRDYNTVDELLNEIFDMFSDSDIPTKYWFIKNNEYLYNSLCQRLKQGQYFTIII